MNIEPNGCKTAVKHRLGQEVYIMNPNETTREAEINCQNYLASQHSSRWNAINTHYKKTDL